MNFSDAIRTEATYTRTENGALALNTTGSGLVDLFSTIGALRNPNGKNKRTSITAENKRRAEMLFDEAVKQDPLIATKILFYARDIREGLGEREVFRYILNYAAKAYPNLIINNIDLIGVFGRYDDLYALIDTPLEDKMWEVMKNQFEEDLRNMEAGNAVSLLGRWVKTADASTANTRELGILTARKLGYSVYNYKRKYRALRKYIGVIEGLMCTGQWDKINYSEVPSRAMTIYRNAFMRHDEAGFRDYLSKLQSTDPDVRNTVKINASTLYPYDIAEKLLDYGYDYSRRSVKEYENDITVLEEQWKALPNYVEEGTNALVIADTSGSMWGRPLASSVGLALYFAERNHGAYENMFMTFSNKSEIVTVQGNSLRQKLSNISKANWGMNTNLAAAFEHILDIAITHNVASEDMVKSLIIISDMEIDACTNRNDFFYDEMQRKYREHGYELPNIIFWNVDSRHDTFHVNMTRKGVQCFSGQSASTFKSIMQTVGMTHYEAMLKVINNERYDCITIR